MDIGFFEYSCVLQAQSHNPTIINPDWLKKHGIVPESWVVDQPLIITPALAQIHFDSGVNIVLQAQKLIVTAAGNDSELQAKAASVVQQYAETLPHIPFQGLGHNAKAGLEVPDSHKALLDLVGNSLDLDAPAVSASVKATYNDINGAVRNVTIEAGEASRQASHEDEPRAVDVVLVDVNYHRACENLAAVSVCTGFTAIDMDNFGQYMESLGERFGL